MTDRHHRSHRPRQRTNAGFEFAPPSAPATSLLVRLTDLGLVGSLWLVTGWFGGRTPMGHVLLCLCACLAAGAWTLYQLGSAERRWTRSGSELLWLAALLIVGLQLAQIPTNWLEQLSPRLDELFPVWFGDSRPEFAQSSWQTLSLAPGSTIQGLPVLLAYALLFFTALQRLQTQEDIEQYLRWIAAAAASWAALSLVQLAFHNGKYYWLFETPVALNVTTATGPFTNRNHFSQFLALGLAPLVWCVLSARPQVQPAAHSRRTHTNHAQMAVFWCLALGVTVIAGVLTLSRGGFVAMACALGVPLLVMLRMSGSRQAWLVVLIGAVVLGTGSLGLDQLMNRFATKGDNGRWPIWTANWEVACDFPWLGTGVGTHINAHQLHLATPAIDREYTHAESSFLQVASETGFVGLGIALLAVLFALSGPLRTIVASSQPERVGCAAAVLGSLLGNAVHALADFIWYVPSCMVMALFLAACGIRLHQLLREELQGRAASRPASLAGWTMRAGGIAVASALCVMLSASGAQGESHVWQYHQLSWQSDSRVNSLDEIDRESYERDKAQAAIAAARLRPEDSRMQLAAARVCLRQFERAMQKSEAPMTLLELRDATIASQFETPEAAREWVMKVVGKRWKLLQASQRFAERAVRASPLEGRAYLVLAELSFLQDPSGQQEAEFLRQALKLRPSDPVVRYDLGQRELLAGKVAAALEHWAYTFKWNPSQRPAIANMLSAACTADVLIEKLDPDWESAARLAAAFDANGQPAECDRMRARTAQLSAEFAQQHPSDSNNEKAWLLAIDSLASLGRTDESLQVLERAVQQQPQQIRLRKRLGHALLEAGQREEALQHLKWVASREPDDAGLAATIDQAYRQRPSSRLAESPPSPLQ